MDGDLQLPVRRKFGRRAAVLMTGVALSALYVWMEPASLATLEANSAQAAEGPGGCVLKIGATPLTVGGREVRVQSSELCNGARPNMPQPVSLLSDTSAGPPRLLRATLDARAELPKLERFGEALPRQKPMLANAVNTLLAEAKLPEADPHHTDDLERALARAAGPGGDGGSGGEDGHDGGGYDGGEHGGEDGGGHDDGGEHGGDGGDGGGHDDGGEHDGGSGDDGGGHDDGGEHDGGSDGGHDDGGHDDGGEHDGGDSGHDDGGERDSEQGTGGESGGHDDGGHDDGGEHGGEGGESGGGHSGSGH